MPYLFLLSKFVSGRSFSTREVGKKKKKNSNIIKKNDGKVTKKDSEVGKGGPPLRALINYDENSNEVPGTLSTK